MSLNYTLRVNNALEFIDNHLNTDLSLEKIAEIAHFSPYHFHRIFKQITNETLNNYINRRRIEKAASDLFRKKTIPINEIAFKYSFNSDSAFSRAFKQFYGISPSQFREQSPSKYSKICQLKSKNSQDTTLFEAYICNMTSLMQWTNMNATTTIKNLPKLNLAYITHIGNPSGIAKAFQQLITWATPNGLMTKNAQLLTIYHNSLKVTPLDKVRMSACIVINTTIETHNEISTKTFSPNKCIVAHYEIPVENFEKAWTGLFVWMNENGYKKSEIDPFEIYHNNFNEHPEKIAIVDLCIPVL